jgi:curved DNA-binding protein CbpA
VRQPTAGSTGPTATEAYDRLGLDPSADQSAVKRAYRERVKEAHPDTDSGSEREFKRVQAAYERLSDD